MSTFLFRVCAVDRFSSSLVNEYRHLTQAHHKALVARAVAATARLRRRRADRAPVTPLQKRRRYHGFQSLQKLVLRRLDMASHQEIRRRSSAADRAPVAPLTTSEPSATTTTLDSAADISRRSYDKPTEDASGLGINAADAAAMPPPPPPAAGDASPTRESRSTSPATRNANRLSLTLPIAPPSSDPSRPTPAYAASNSSMPPTPVDSSTSTGPSNANEFIIAIAAQERRVLELREELSRAEAELSTLKKQWSSQEAYSRKGEPRSVEAPRSAAPSGDDESNASRRSVDFDRRKLLLQNQNTPTQSRRRVLRGGHARTLSLLSPPKPDPGFAVHQDRDQEPVRLPLPPVERRTAQLTSPNLSKRASWQPQSHRRQQASVPGLIEDFRLGFRTFVDDIRQITVGDEPINGQGLSPSPNLHRASASTSLSRTPSGDFETIRPSPAARPKVSTAFDSPSPATSTPTPSSKTKDGTPQEKSKPGRSKHFSWTPLSFDSLDDNGWSNWESPVSAKSTRWSGSTINSGVEDIQSIPEAGEDADEPSKAKTPIDDAPALSPNLKEMLPSMVNNLTPSNIKRTANNLMDEWEKSLVDPQPSADKENTV